MSDPAPPPARDDDAATPPLRWGTSASRVLWGAALIAAGALLVVQTTAYTVPIGWLGAALHVLGWAVLPATGGRRVLAAVTGPVALVVMLAGPSLAWVTSVLLALWLFVRRRPGISYVLVPLPALATILALVTLAPLVPRLAVFAFVFSTAVACAWAAKAIALRERGGNRPRS